MSAIYDLFRKGGKGARGRSEVGQGKRGVIESKVLCCAEQCMHWYDAALPSAQLLFLMGKYFMF